MPRQTRSRAVTREGMTVTVIALPRELHKKLLAITRSTGLALSEQARRALAAWVEQHERKRGKP